MVAVGGLLPAVTSTSAPALAGTLLVTVRWALYAPAIGYVWLGCAAVEGPTYPKRQWEVSGRPFGSLVPALENCTLSGSRPLVGLAEATTDGGELGSM